MKLHNVPYRKYICIGALLSSHFVLRAGGFVPEQSETRSTTASENISLQQAILQALANNGDLFLKRLNVQESIDAVEGERGTFDPSFSGLLQLDRDRSSQSNRGTGSSYEVKNEASDVQVGVSQQFTPGTSVALELSLAQDGSDRTPTQQEARVGISLTQPLMQGRGSDVVLAEIRGADLDLELSRHQWRAYAEALVAETESAYWNLLLAQKKALLLEQSLTVAKQHRENTLSRIEAGFSPASDAASVRSEVALRRQGLLDARSEVIASQWRLWSLIRSSSDSNLPDLQLQTNVLDIVELPDPKANYLNWAQHYRSDLLEAELLRSQRKLDTVVTSNGLLPKLDFFTTLGKSGYDSHAKGAFGEMGKKAFDFSVGLEFQMSLGNRSARSEHAIAMTSEQKASVAIENLKRQIEMEVHLAWNEYQRSREQGEASLTTVQLQEETLRSEEVKLENGVSTSFSLAQAQRDLVASQLTQLEAQVSQHKAITQLYLQSGKLLEYRGVLLR